MHTAIQIGDIIPDPRILNEELNSYNYQRQWEMHRYVCQKLKCIMTDYTEEQKDFFYDRIYRFVLRFSAYFGFNKDGKYYFLKKQNK